MSYPELTQVSERVDDFLHNEGFVDWLLIDHDDIEAVWEEVRGDYGGGRETLYALIENIEESEEYAQGLAEAMTAAFYQFAIEWTAGFLHDHDN